MEKLFTVAGTSRRNGTVKFRFSNDLKGRIPMLVRTGHTEINLVELPEAMSKDRAVQYLRSVGIDIEAAGNTTAPTDAEIVERMDELREAAEAAGNSVDEAALREAAVSELTETADTIRASLAADGEDTSTMTDEFLAEVAARENA